MTEDMQVRNLALNTQTSYVQQVSPFARHFDKSPEQLGPEDIRAYQVYLINEKKLAPGSVLIAVAALRFLYKVSLKKDWSFEDVIPAPKKPQRLPVVLSPEEVLHPKNGSYPGASARRPVLPMTLPPRKQRNAALRISFHRSSCVNCSAIVLMRLRNPLTLVRISAICAAFACVLVISTVVWFP
jgi:hypothetical protein